MSCDDAFEAMRTATPAELRGEGSSLLAFHIRDCVRCKTVARAILSDQAALGAALTSAEPPRTAEAVADAVLAAARAEGIQPGGTAHDVVPIAGKRRRVTTRLRDWRVAVPTLLAAALAALLLLSRDDRDWQVPDPARSAWPAQPGVSPPTGKSVAVFETRNPDIKVIWFY